MEELIVLMRQGGEASAWARKLLNTRTLPTFQTHAQGALYVVCSTLAVISARAS